MAGYSGTSLRKKLDIKEGHKIAFVHKPQGYQKNLGKLLVGVSIADQLSAKDGKKLDWIQLFATARLACNGISCVPASVLPATVRSGSLGRKSRRV
jgi:hypothetical protein